MSKTLDELTRPAIAAMYAHRERQLIDCLGHWASGLEPVQAVRMGTGEFLGLTVEGSMQIIVPVNSAID